MKAAAIAASLAVLPALAACGPGEPVLRLRHDAKRVLSYTLEQHEDAPHPEIGLGGSLDVAIGFGMSCVNREADGSGHYEVTVRSVKITAPPESGAGVDTASGRPAEGDRIGANAVTLSLLPRHAMVLVLPTAAVRGAQPDLDVGKRISNWMATQPPASRKVIWRLGEALDAGPVAHRWFTSASALLPRNEHVPHGTTWKASPPPIETPAGFLAPTIDVMYRREGDIAVLEGRGTLAIEGEPPADRPIDFESATLDMTARIDVVRGVLVAYDESGRFEFRLRDASRVAAPWSHTRKLRLVSDAEAGVR